MSRYKVTATVNIRSGPGTQYDVEGQLGAGEIVQVVDNLAGWLPVLVVDQDGAEDVCWASVKYLKLAGEDEEEVTPPTPSKVITGKMVVAKAMTQSGDPYVYGYEVNLDDPNPAKFDCSELVQWVSHQLNIMPIMPDGSAAQREFCRKHGTMITIEQAVKTPGTLLFGDGHVAISRGDGTTIEARGKAYGVGTWSSKNRPWIAAAKIPGVKYE